MNNIYKCVYLGTQFYIYKCKRFTFISKYDKHGLISLYMYVCMFIYIVLYTYMYKDTYICM